MYVMDCQQNSVGHYLDQKVQVRRAGEHLDNEYGEEGNDVVLGCLDSVCDMSGYLVASVNFDGTWSTLVFAFPFSRLLVAIFAPL